MVPNSSAGHHRPSIGRATVLTPGRHIVRAKPECLPRADALRFRVRDRVFELNRAVSSLRLHVREWEARTPLELRRNPEFQKILAESRVGIDQIYEIMIQLRWAAFADAPESEPPSTPDREERSEALTPSLGTVYIVDDNASLRRALSRLFRSVGYEVEAFASAPDFLEKPTEAHPACVVLDVRMPRMSGLDLQTELATRNSDLPIVFITGHGDIDMAVKAMKDGAVDFLPKPFDDQDLLDSVARALAHHQSVRPVNDRRREALERFARLTPREREVFERVIRGMLNKQIGSDLGTTEKTVKVHRARVMAKMQAQSLVDLVRMAADLGVGEPIVPDED